MPPYWRAWHSERDVSVCNTIQEGGPHVASAWSRPDVLIRTGRVTSVSNSQPGEDSSRLRRGRLYRRPSREAPEARRLLGPRRRSEVPRASARPTADDFVIGDLRDPISADKSSTAASTRSTSWPPTWAAPATSSPASTTPTSCTTRRPSISTCSTRAASGTCGGIFYSSSACMYPEYNQEDPDNPNCAEDSAYPAAPDSEYGWEKLFSERLYLAYARNHGDANRIARYHNIFGPEGHLGRRPGKGTGGALPQGRIEPGTAATIEIWGDGQQTRSFLYIDECLEGTMPADALGVRRPGQHRFGRDGHHQRARRYGRRYRRQENSHRSTSPVRSACAAATPTTA